jgi:hypothetical protein
MKTAAVPAQITTVEDKIIGGLSPYQLTLVIMPLCFGFLAYAALPPNLHLALYKIGIVVFLELLGLVASVRIKGRMLLQWLLMITRYNLRPRYYVYNKNDPYLRNGVEQNDPTEADPKVADVATTAKVKRPQLDLAQIVKLEGIMADPRAKMRFVMRKGGKTNVVISEVK